MKKNILTEYLILQLLTAVQKINYIDACSDKELLHKFRVSIRKVRSLIKLFLPKEKELILKLKNIMNPTNILRELDVFIEDIDKKAYNTLYSELVLYRQKKFRKILHKKFISNALEELLDVCDTLYEIDNLPSFETLIQTTQKHYDKTLAKKQKLSHMSPTNEKLHKLRIKFKVAHYALSFLDETDICEKKEELGVCKEFQKYFGEIQDLDNQIKWLKEYYKTYPSAQCHIVMMEKEQELDRLKALHVKSD